MLAVDNQATGLLFIHDNIRRRIDAHRAFRALFPRSARTRSAPPVHLVASQPASPRHAESPKPRRLGCLSVVSLVSDLVRRVSLRWKGTGFYWPADSAGAVYINEECQGEIPMGRLRRLRGAERISLGFGHWSDFEFRLPIPNWNPIDRMLGKLDPKPEFRDEMAGFRKARRFQRDYLAIIDFYNVSTGPSIQSTGGGRVCMHG